MSNFEQAARQALDALKNAQKVRAGEGGTKHQAPLENAAITVLEAALAQQQVDPVVMQYIALCDAMRYSEREDEWLSPEEYAESLVAEIDRLKQQAEPVAWPVCSVCLEPNWDMYLLEKKPVQAEPVVARPQRRSLTDEERRAMWRASDFRGNGGQIDWFIEGTRAAEVAHGITGKQAEPVSVQAEPVAEPTFSVRTGCRVCGVGDGGKAMGYVCPRIDCPMKGESK
jgi:hypothetical protein